MSEQAEKARFRVRVPAKPKEFLVVLDLKDVHDKTIGYPRMRAVEAIKLFSKWTYHKTD
jgi:hypothetical protein